MRCDVGAGTSLATALTDGGVEVVEAGDDAYEIGIASETSTFVEKFPEGAMPTFAVASSAGRDLVLHPTRSALDTRNEVFSGGLDVTVIEGAPAPHTRRPVPVENDRHSLPAIGEVPAARHRWPSGASSWSHPWMLPCVRPGAHNGDVAGRFAPSPTGELHVGNLRTAVAAAAAARGADLAFLIRVDDLDRVQYDRTHEEGQLADLAAVGVVSDQPPVRQSERFELYRDAIATLHAAGEVYECFCSRREIRAEIAAAASAPHGHRPDGAYPGTCRELSRRRREELEREGRRPALRLRTAAEVYTVDDVIAGRYTGAVDDVVLQRNDGVPAYNLAVVVDDADQGVTQVVRGDDLLSSTPRHIHLQQRLGLVTPEYWHVPLVVDAEGRRLAKRFGAPSLSDLGAAGIDSGQVTERLRASLGVDDVGVLRAAEVPRHTVTCEDLGLVVPGDA